MHLPSDFEGAITLQLRVSDLVSHSDTDSATDVITFRNRAEYRAVNHPAPTHGLPDAALWRNLGGVMPDGVKLNGKVRPVSD